MIPAAFEALDDLILKRAVGVEEPDVGETAETENQPIVAADDVIVTVSLVFIDSVSQYRIGLRS
jgi:hypothetical protein